MNDLILLRRKNKVIVEKGNSQLSKQYLATILKNIESLGYVLSKKLLNVVKTLDYKDAVNFYNNLIANLRNNIGANRKFNPIYPNFPQQVMDASDIELYLNAYIHYLTTWLSDIIDGKIQSVLPNYKKEKREDLRDDIVLKVIDLGSEKELQQICINLISSKTSLSQTDKEDVEWFVKNYSKDISKFLPETIPLKENVALLANLLMKYVQNGELYLCKYFKTATDVLRFAVSLSDGDISLAKPTKFKHFKRKERRLLLSLLESELYCKNIIEDMLRFKTQWIKLGEYLHPGDYKNRYKRVYDAFDILRNNEPFETFNSKVEKLLKEHNVKEASKLLKNRPGDFARKLDRLLRLTSNRSSILVNFEEIANKISTPVLLQVHSHFKNRNKNTEQRIFFPKGNVAKCHLDENNLKKINEETCKEVVSICEKILVKKFSNLPELGNVYIDEKLKGFLVPFSQRSASKALRTIVRGSKIDIPKGNTLRFFLWWKNISKDDYSGRVDIDLTAATFDEEWKSKGFISWTSLRASNFKGYHSGDITNAPKGACEFIDIDIESAINVDIRYIMANLYCYSGQPYSTIPKCFMGWMLRQHPNSGEIFDPKTVQDKIDITADTTVCIPFIFDLVERKMIWCDLALKKNLAYNNCYENNSGSVVLMGKAMTNLVKPTLYDLFKMHIKGRGKTVKDKKEADIVFSINEGITPFDIDKIMADYL